MQQRPSMQQQQHKRQPQLLRQQQSRAPDNIVSKCRQCSELLWDHERRY